MNSEEGIVMSRPVVSLDYRIPIIPARMFSGRYTDHPVDTNDSRFHEPMIPLKSVGVAFENYFARTDGNNPPYNASIPGSPREVWLRKTVAEKLAAVNLRLRPWRAELFILDGYRPMACHKHLWAFFLAKAKTLDPDATEKECRAYAMQYVVDPARFDERDSRTWPAHSTGAAVDLTLRDSSTGELLDMGARFEELIDARVTDYFERQLENGTISETDVRLQNRRLLHWAMTTEGLLNETANVFWHYDYGNQNYIRACRALLPDPVSIAWYGYASA